VLEEDLAKSMAEALEIKNLFTPKTTVDHATSVNLAETSKGRVKIIEN